MGTDASSGAKIEVVQRLLVVVLLTVLSSSLAGCGLSIPTDPHGSLGRVRSSEVLRVGASPRPGWVEVG